MSITKFSPCLRFHGFLEQWSKEKLGNSCSFQQGVQIDLELQSAEPVENFVRFLRIENYTQNSQDFRYVPAELARDKHINTDEIAIVRYGATAGYIAKGLSGVLANNLFKVIVNRDKFDINFLFHYLKSDNVFKYFQIAMAGGAMPALSFEIASSLNISFPSLPEQQKIASFLTTVDEKLQALKKKKTLLEQYKKGIMQKIFSQEIRFRDNNGKEFPKWENRHLFEVLKEHCEKSKGSEEVFSVSVHKGVINQIEHLGRSFAAKSTSHYNLVKPNDIIYTKSPTGDFPYGIIKQSKIKENVIVSPLYGVFTPETEHLGYILDVYFESANNVYNYLASIIQKGAKNTINITNEKFLSKSLFLPISFDEQAKIASFIKSINDKINHCQTQIEKTEMWKKGLLQRMFC